MGRSPTKRGSDKRSCPQAVFLDFDGVIVESRDIKTWAFGQLFSQPPDLRHRVQKYHLENMGLSRWKKFEHIYRHFLKKSLSQPEKKRLGRRFSQLVFWRVCRCPLVKGMRRFLLRGQKRTRFFVVSGTPQTELRKLVKKRKLNLFFEGVYGSPWSKSKIVQTLFKNKRFDSHQTVFVGDAEEDRKAARSVGARFVGRVPPGERSPFPKTVPLIRNFVGLDWDTL